MNLFHVCESVGKCIYIRVCVWLHVSEIRIHLPELDPIPIIVKEQSDPDDIRQVYVILSLLTFVSILTLSLNYNF